MGTSPSAHPHSSSAARRCLCLHCHGDATRFLVSWATATRRRGGRGGTSQLRPHSDYVACGFCFPFPLGYLFDSFRRRRCSLLRCRLSKGQMLNINSFFGADCTSSRTVTFAAGLRTSHPGPLCFLVCEKHTWRLNQTLCGTSQRARDGAPTVPIRYEGAAS